MPFFGIDKALQQLPSPRSRLTVGTRTKTHVGKSRAYVKRQARFAGRMYTLGLLCKYLQGFGVDRKEPIKSILY